jgi:hypothetical protein
MEWVPPFSLGLSKTDSSAFFLNPFLSAEWNDLAGMPQAALLDDDSAEYDRLFDQFERKYWNSSIVNGAIPICHQGCALRIWLVIAGERTGQLWQDKRSDHKGVVPVRLRDGSLATFSNWYCDWLEDALQQAQLHL